MCLQHNSKYHHILLTKNSECDHDQLCRLCVLGIEDQPTGDQQFVYQKFQDQYFVIQKVMKQNYFGRLDINPLIT